MNYTEAIAGNVLIQLLAEENARELQKYFVSQVEFGTAGPRAAMRAGISHMNDLTISQATQKFCRYLENNFRDLKKGGVLIGFVAQSRSFDHLQALFNNNKNTIVL